MSFTYTTAHGNTGYLTHWARPGVKPATLCFLVRFISTAPQWKHLSIHLYTCNFWPCRYTSRKSSNKYMHAFLQKYICEAIHWFFNLILPKCSWGFLLWCNGLMIPACLCGGSGPFPAQHSGLTIWCRCSCDVGHSSCSYSTPSSRTSVCLGCGQNRRRRKRSTVDLQCCADFCCTAR